VNYKIAPCTNQRPTLIVKCICDSYSYRDNDTIHPTSLPADTDKGVQFRFWTITLPHEIFCGPTGYFQCPFVEPVRIHERLDNFSKPQVGFLPSDIGPAGIGEDQSSVDNDGFVPVILGKLPSTVRVSEY